MTVWFVLDMDDGALGAFRTKKEAVDTFTDGCPHSSYRYGPGSYEIRWWFEGDREDGGSFFLERDDRVDSGGWDWAYRPWIAAGRPMGRFSEPLGRDEPNTS